VLTETQDNQGLVFRLSSPAGNTLWQSNNPMPNKNQAHLTIDDDYGGLFQGYRLSVVIEPSLATQLVIGGLPYDQLPQLIVLMALALCAMLAMLWIHLKLHKLHRQQQQFIARASH